MYKLAGNIHSIDTSIRNKLASTFRDDVFQNNIQEGFDFDTFALPSAEDTHPLAIVFSNGELLLLWIAETDMAEWVTRLQEYGKIRVEERNESVLIRSKENYFSATIYMHLQRKVEMIPYLPTTNDKSEEIGQEEVKGEESNVNAAHVSEECEPDPTIPPDEGIVEGGGDETGG